jgi:hypothetical protein
MWAKLIFTTNKDAPAFDEFNQRSLFHDAETGVMFESKAALEHFVQLRSFFCVVCQGDGVNKRFVSMQALEKHIANTHGLFYW